MTVPMSLILAGLLLANPASAQERPCASAHHREFDFWLGTWEVFERGSDQKAADVQVTAELDGCVIREEYRDAGGLRGTSLSSYDATSQKWQQTWITNRGQLLVIHGRRDHASMAFSGWMYEGATETLVRATWTPEADGVRETAERSTDGGRTWRAWFDLSFRRSGPPAPPGPR